MNYRVPFVAYPEQYRRLSREIDCAIKRVLNGGDLILREDVRRFEKDIASSLGMEYAVGTNSCTDAMVLSLRAAGISPGDEVITVSHTFVATVAAIVHCGATPVLVDIGQDFNMDMDCLEGAITPQTRAIMPVHLNGRCCDMDRLMAIARTYNLIVIEDAAQALGASMDGRKASTFGLAGCFSFYPAKLLGALGDAGIAITNDKMLAKRVSLLRDHGRETKDDIGLFGFNSRLDNLQAAILNVKLKYVPQWIEQRREIAALYHEGLGDIEQLILPPPPETGERYFDVYQNYVIRSQERERLVEHLNRCGIEILVVLAKPVHRQAALGLGHFHLPVTEQVSEEVLSLPMYPELSNEQVEYVIDSVRQFYRGQQ
jgi:dTDP-4-amino-4,6-dideoxygalactose transaminase